MTDPVARNRLAALLNDAAMAAWLDHLNPQAPWPMDSMLFVADYLLAAGVLPPDALARVRAEIEAHGTTTSRGPNFEWIEGHEEMRAAVLAILDGGLEAASGTPKPPCDHPCHRAAHDIEGPTVMHLLHDPCPVHVAPATVIAERLVRAAVPPPAAPGLGRLAPLVYVRGHGLPDTCAEHGDIPGNTSVAGHLQTHHGLTYEAFQALEDADEVRGIAPFDFHDTHDCGAINAVAPPPAAPDALALLDVIDGIVDDTHPEGDGCPLCVALDDLRTALERT